VLLPEQIERFWSTVDRQPFGCWEYKGGRTGRGYGRFPLGERSRGVAAHRLSAELTMDDWNPSLMVLHSCDNEPCCRPSHLFQGTQLDNRRDSIAKGRGVLGETHGMSRLTEMQVREIRDRRLRGEKLLALAADYGVSFSTISDVVHRTWKWVT